RTVSLDRGQLGTAGHGNGRPRRASDGAALQAGGCNEQSARRLAPAHRARTAFSSTDSPSFKRSSDITSGGTMRTTLSYVPAFNKITPSAWHADRTFE